MLVMKASMARKGVTVLRMLLDPGLLVVLFWPTLTIIEADHTDEHLPHYLQYSPHNFISCISVHWQRGFTILTVSDNLIHPSTEKRLLLTVLCHTPQTIITLCPIILHILSNIVSLLNYPSETQNKIKESIDAIAIWFQWLQWTLRSHRYLRSLRFL